MGRNNPIVSSVNETEILIIGGNKSGPILKDAYAFNTVTNETSYLGDSGLQCYNYPKQTALINESGQIIAYDRTFTRLIQVTRNTSSGTVSAVAVKRSKAAANQVTSVPKYDSNYVLNQHGLKELTEV